MKKNNQEYINIKGTIDEMTTYFSRIYSEHDAMLQEYKAKLFEVNIRLDELLRTQNVYSLNMDYRKNIFSPISSKAEENEKELEIEKSIKELKKERDRYEDGISEESIYLKSIDKRIKKLNTAATDLSIFQNNYNDTLSILEEKNSELKDKEDELEELDNEINKLDRKIQLLEEEKEKNNKKYYERIKELEHKLYGGKK